MNWKRLFKQKRYFILCYTASQKDGTGNVNGFCTFTCKNGAYIKMTATREYLNELENIVVNNIIELSAKDFKDFTS